MNTQKLSLLVLYSFSCNVHGLSMSTSCNERSQLSRGRLKEALYSPSGKLTFSPEIIIPEPSDPTALLLQSSEVIKMSDRLRTNGKINAAFLSGSFSTVNQFITEQEEARGSFPGPVPVIYSAFSGIDNDDSTTLESLAEFGCCGIVTSVCSGQPISSVDDLKDMNEEWMEKAIAAGVQPIPEVVLDTTKAWEVDDISQIIESLKNSCGGDEEPVAVVLTLNKVETEDNDETDGDEMWNNIPKFPRSFSKKTPVLGSIRVSSMDDLTDYSAKLKSKGFTGAFLRADCVPGFRMNPDLDFVGGFWSSVISNLKSTKSKSFEFRTKSQLERDVPLEWMNYQKNVMESGALGSNSASSSLDELNTEAGDYQGF